VLVSHHALLELCDGGVAVRPEVLVVSVARVEEGNEGRGCQMNQQATGAVAPSLSYRYGWTQ